MDLIRQRHLVTKRRRAINILVLLLFMAWIQQRSATLDLAGKGQAALAFVLL